MIANGVGIIGHSRVAAGSDWAQDPEDAVQDAPVVNTGNAMRSKPMPSTGKTGQPEFPRLSVTGHAADMLKSMRMTHLGNRLATDRPLASFLICVV
jgi:hypothetical protein